MNSDDSYKKYSLEKLDEWLNDALNCEDTEAQDIYDTIIKSLDESVEYHSKFLEKGKKLQSLLKEQRTLLKHMVLGVKKKYVSLKRKKESLNVNVLS